MKPIPLEWITKVLNDELMATDPRFEHAHLLYTSVTGSQDQNRSEERELSAELLIGEPDSVEHRDLFVFKRERNVPYFERNLQVAYRAADEVHGLSEEQKMCIYQQTRSHDACFKAIGLFDYFFNLLPEGQCINVQTRGQTDTLLLTPSIWSRRAPLYFQISRPKNHTIVAFTSARRKFHTGSRDLESHVVLVLPTSATQPMTIPAMTASPNSYIVVDMTRMQYGLAGRYYGKQPYFIGTLAEYRVDMTRICGVLWKPKILRDLGQGTTEAVLRRRLQVCVDRTWRAWKNRVGNEMCMVCGQAIEADLGYDTWRRRWTAIGRDLVDQRILLVGTLVHANCGPLMAV